jgi:hypothetical protein
MRVSLVFFSCLALGLFGCPDDDDSGESGGAMAAGGSSMGGSSNAGSDDTGGTMPGGSADGGAMPGGSAEGGAMPGGTMPGGTMTGGAMPGGAMPGGAMPGGEMAGGAMPGGEMGGPGPNCTDGMDDAQRVDTACTWLGECAVSECSFSGEVCVETVKARCVEDGAWALEVGASPNLVDQLCTHTTCAESLTLRAIDLPLFISRCQEGAPEATCGSPD